MKCIFKEICHTAEWGRFSDTSTKILKVALFYKTNYKWTLVLLSVNKYLQTTFFFNLVFFVTQNQIQDYFFFLFLFLAKKAVNIRYICASTKTCFMCFRIKQLVNVKTVNVRRIKTHIGCLKDIHKNLKVRYTVYQDLMIDCTYNFL